MKRAAAVIVLVCGVASAIEPQANDFLLQKTFQQWKVKYGKFYSTEEEESLRFKNFVASVERVGRRKTEAQNPEVFGLTKFSDMTSEEFKTRMLNYKPSAQAKASPYDAKRYLRASTPASYDWRDYGAVTPVKDQGYCGSCWAHSAVETVESAWYLAGNTLTEFSVEQVNQCDTKDGGCNGGNTETAYAYIESAGGLATAASYPYTNATYYGTTGTCQSFTVAGGSISGYTYATPKCSTLKCNSQDEATLASNLASTQPASVCVYAESWQDYTSGVMAESDCKNSYLSLDHCVQAVGFNAISGSDGYWIVRNSWNTDWGVDGYIYLAYGTNTCGVADDATFVTIA